VVTAAGWSGVGVAVTVGVAVAAGVGVAVAAAPGVVVGVGVAVGDAVGVAFMSGTGVAVRPLTVRFCRCCSPDVVPSVWGCFAGARWDSTGERR
jgi:hypothetical protein